MKPTTKAGQGIAAKLEGEYGPDVSGEWGFKDWVVECEQEAVAVERARLSEITPDLFRLRLSLIEGVFVPELRCPHCTQWLLVDTENWEKDEWHMCLACKRMKAKLYAALRQRDEQYRKDKAVKNRRYRAWLKENYPQYIQAYDRERKARGRAWARQYREKEGASE